MSIDQGSSESPQEFVRRILENVRVEVAIPQGFPCAILVQDHGRRHVAEQIIHALTCNPDCVLTEYDVVMRVDGYNYETDESILAVATLVYSTNKGKGLVTDYKIRINPQTVGAEA